MSISCAGGRPLFVGLQCFKVARKPIDLDCDTTDVTRKLVSGYMCCLRRVPWEIESRQPFSGSAHPTRMATTTEKSVKLLRSRHDLPEEARKAIISLLNDRLADTFDLYSQIKQSHWNVQGQNFFQLHELFDQLAAEILPFVDEIAERVTALGGVAAGTSRMAAKASGLRENDLGATDGRQHLDLLIDRYSHYAAAIRKGIDQADDKDDKDTADLFTQVSRTADKHLWFLEAHTR